MYTPESLAVGAVILVGGTVWALWLGRQISRDPEVGHLEAAAPTAGAPADAAAGTPMTEHAA